MNTQVCKTLSPKLETFSRFIQDNQGLVSPQMFAEEFGKIQKQYLSAKQKDTFC